MEAQRQQDRDLGAARRDCRIHRVDGPEDRADRHDAGDHQGKDLENPAQKLGLLNVEIDLAICVDGESLVGLQGPLGLLECRGILEPEGHRLESLPPKHRHELLVLSPDLRLEGGAAGRESAHHIPMAPGKAEVITHRSVIESSRHLLPHAHLGPPRFRLPPFLHLDLAADRPGRGTDPAHHHVGDNIGVGALPWQWNEDVHLGADHGPAIGARRDMRRRTQDTRGLPVQAAGQLGVGSPPQDQHVLTRPGAGECGVKAVGQREHADEDRDHQRDPQRGEGGGDRPLEQAPGVVAEGDLHSTRLSA